MPIEVEVSTTVRICTIRHISRLDRSYCIVTQQSLGLLYYHIAVVQSTSYHFVAFVVEVQQSAYFEVVAHSPKHIILLELRCDYDVLATLGTHDDCFCTEIEFDGSCKVRGMPEDDLVLEEELRLVRVL